MHFVFVDHDSLLPLHSTIIKPSEDRTSPLGQWCENVFYRIWQGSFDVPLLGRKVGSCKTVPQYLLIEKEGDSFLFLLKLLN